MEDLIGSEILSIDGSLTSTKEILNDTEFVALYFSASWCGPCRYFTPQLKQFYHNVNNSKNNNDHDYERKDKKFEVVFVSLDRNLTSFYQYYASMPWLAIPLQTPGGISQKIINSLSSQFWVNSIPSLVVLTKDGLYVTNKAKSQISSIVLNKGSDPDTLIESWRMTNHVPIDEANFGIIPSIYSSFKKGYNYFMGIDNTSGANSKLVSNVTSKTSHQNIENLVIPSQLLISFFKKANERLESHPSPLVQGKLLVKDEQNVNYDEDMIPVKLPLHRQMILDEQMKVLEEVISFYNSNRSENHVSCDTNGTCTLNSHDHSKNISINDVQECLRMIGSGDFSGVQNLATDVEDLIKESMQAMNCSARNAYVLSVLWAEFQWSSRQVYTPISKQNQETKESMIPGTYCLIEYDKVQRYLRRENEKDNIDDQYQLDRSIILEYCGLCTAALKNPAVLEYIFDGKHIFPNVDTDFTPETCEESYEQQHRIHHVQNMLMCAVGYDPLFGGSKLRGCLDKIKSNNNDTEVKDVLTNYINVINKTATNAILDSATKEFSDEKIRVVYAKVADTSASHEESSPPVQAMDQQQHEKQHEALRRAKDSSNLEKQLIDELNNMSEQSKNQLLEEAKSFHDEFMNKMSTLQSHERVNFMLNLDPLSQRKLLLYKLSNK